MGDLKPPLLASSLAKIHECLTPQSIMHLGGELFETKKKALADFKHQDTSQSLEVRLSLAQQLQSAERSWKDRLFKIVDLGLPCLLKYGASSHDFGDH